MKGLRRHHFLYSDVERACCHTDFSVFVKNYPKQFRVMNRREKQRFEGFLLFTCGAWNTFESWTKVLFPFMLWSLRPRPDFDHMIYIQAWSSICTFAGIFLIAYLVNIAHIPKNTRI